VRKIRMDSYKKLLRKPWLKSGKSFRSLTQKKKYRGISNLNEARALYRDDSCAKKKSAPPHFGKMPKKSPFELDSEDENDLELNKQLDPKNLIGFNERKYDRQNCEAIEW